VTFIEGGNSGKAVARTKAGDLQTEADRQKLLDARKLLARDVRNAWQNSRRALSVSPSSSANRRALLSTSHRPVTISVWVRSRVHPGLQKIEADIQDTDAKYQYRLTQIVLAYTIAAPK
jgi:hypothetical protein